MRRELLRQKWEKEEMENLKKDNLHYGDVLFDEARAHGAGFYAFSKDEVRSRFDEILRTIFITSLMFRQREVKSKIL